MGIGAGDRSRGIVAFVLGELGFWFYWIGGLHGTFALAKTYGIANVSSNVSAKSAIGYFLTYVAIGFALKLLKELR